MQIVGEQAVTTSEERKQYSHRDEERYLKELEGSNFAFPVVLLLSQFVFTLIRLLLAKYSSLFQLNDALARDV